jgi:peptide-methionine (S)-S-oxide reductase
MTSWKNSKSVTETDISLRTESDFSVPNEHYTNGNQLQGPFPEDTETLFVAMGCFWGAERLFWQLDGVYSTAVGYQGGVPPFPTYSETCSGDTGHAEAVQIVYRPSEISLAEILKVFWEEHDPTQGMRQGNDMGSQYRSAVFTTSEEQLSEVLVSKEGFEAGVTAAGYPPITTEIGPADTFYYAEEYHQQYLAKNPSGYCDLKGTGVTCSV